MLRKALPGPMTNFFPISERNSDFSFPTFRLSDFFGPLSGSPDGLLLYNNALPPSPTRSNELRRGLWQCSATFGAIDRDHECHLHEAKSALTFRLSQFSTFRHPVSDFPTLPSLLSAFPTFRLLLSDFPTSPFRLSNFPTFRLLLSDFSTLPFRLSDFPTSPFLLSDLPIKQIQQ
jgi:hypothetical protein